ncbi:DUF805 domain-containing protein [Halocynthiibacter namhaensis]|uniref:DUF805 domain-containing protein n=1 Tax=Halocynthiibacter namhaensis TaxID=1290553 RepID=UPI000578E697|nr:DUF805 domain-containing protein [Halocynthiibacter namhaensis]
MGFKEAIRTCLFEKYITFSGRASRSEYWWFYLFLVLCLATFAIIFAVVMSMQPSNTAIGVIFTILGLPLVALYIPLISVMVRRFHDRDMSGWLVLVAMLAGAIPYIGVLISIWFFVMTVMKGTEGDNRFGSDPLKLEHSEDVFA